MAIVPVPNPIVNNIVVSYQYQVSPTAPLTTAENISNDVSIQVSTADLSSVKIVDIPYAKVGTTLTYTVTLANSGNVSAQSVVLIDTVPTGTTFVPNSMSINGVSTIANPNYSGVTIPDILPSGIATVTWQVTVNTIPTLGEIPNSAVTNYSYTVSPTSAPLNGVINSNVVLTTINQAYIDFGVGGGFVKSENVKYATVNDTITYTLRLNNTGNITATSVRLFDTIPTGTTFVDGSVRLNGTTQPGAYPYPPSGMFVGDIGAHGVSTVTFQVFVNSVPSTGNVINNASVNYTFTVNPGSAPIASGGNSNPISTTIVQAYINNIDGGLVKSANTSYAKIGDIITYYIILKNTGNESANNLFVQDTIPAGTTFVPNSFAINGGAIAGANPQNGVTIPNGLLPGAVMTLSFNATVTSIPTTDPTPNIANLVYHFTVDPNLPQRTALSSSNIALVTINSAILNPITKTVDHRFTIPGDTLTYTITINNTGNTTADNLVLVDTIPTGTILVPDSLRVNTTPRLGANPQSGVTLPNVGPGGSLVVTFQVVVQNSIA